MDSQDHVGEPLGQLQLVYHLDLPGRDSPENDERAQYIITRALAGLVKEISGAGSVQVEVLWDRRVWRPDGEAALPRGHVWQLSMCVRPESVQ